MDILQWHILSIRKSLEAYSSVNRIGDFISVLRLEIVMLGAQRFWSIRASELFSRVAVGA